MRGVIAAGLSAALIIAVALPRGSVAAERTVLAPAPAIDPAPAKAGAPAVALLAGGCFWGVEAVFERVRGVRSVTSGYAGGSRADARYEKVSAGGTDHAEAVRIVYDPAVVSYGTLLRVFMSVAHDPTERNRQGPDIGRHYRGAIFPVDAGQRRVASAYLAQLTRAKTFDKPIATGIEGPVTFYPAETYHQDFMTKNPRHPYIVTWDVPKIAALKARFPKLVKS